MIWHEQRHRIGDGARVCGYLFEALLLAAPVLIVEKVDLCSTDDLGMSLRDADDAIGMSKRQRFEQ
jgi:hypothetical protein